MLGVDYYVIDRKELLTAYGGFEVASYLVFPILPIASRVICGSISKNILLGINKLQYLYRHLRLLIPIGC